MVGAIAALRRAMEGGSYRVRVARVSLWLLQMGTFDKAYTSDVARGGGDRAYPDPDLFEAETPCGHYQGVTEMDPINARARVRAAAIPHDFVSVSDHLGSIRRVGLQNN
jgi:hypothetical protein